MISKIRECFKAALIDDTPKCMIRCYSAIKMLECIKNKSWQYNHAAWKFYSRQITDRIGGQFFRDDFEKSQNFARLFNCLYDELSQLCPRDFFTLFTHGYVASPEAFAIVGPMNQKKPGSVALAVLYAKEHFGARPSKHPDYIMEIFKENVKLERFFLAVNGYPFTYKRETYTAAIDVINTFHSYNCHQVDYILNVYLLAREHLYGNNYSEEMKTFCREVSVSAAGLLRTISGKKLDLLGMDDANNRVLSKMGRISCPTDLLEVALVEASSDDCTIEQGCIYTKFFEQQSFQKDDRILVINAAPSFIKRHASSDVMAQTTFAVESEIVAKVLRQQFKTANFCSIDQLDEIAEKTCKKVLFFSRGMEQKRIDHILRVIRALCYADARVYCVLPANMVTWTNPDKSLVADLPIEWINLFPKETFVSSPKKKVLVCLGPSGSNRIMLTKHKLLGRKKNYLYVADSVCIDKDMLVGSHSIYDLFRKSKEKKLEEDKKRKDPSVYQYTSDISFWYTSKISKQSHNPVIEAYICQRPTHEQEKRRKNKRGKKIPESTVSVSTLSSPEEISAWFEETLPYMKRIHDYVQSTFRGVPAEELSMKTIWYLQLDVENCKADPSFEDEKNLISQVGSIFYGDEEKLIKKMDEFCEDMSISDRLKYWKFIRKMCNAIENYGVQVQSNIAEKQIYELQKLDEGNIGEVRNALAKKTLSLDEEIRLLRFLHERIKTEPEYLGVLLHFYTGLPSRIISALTWKDFQRIPYLKKIGVYQLCIYEQYDNESKEIIPLQNADEYRCIPACAALSKALLERKKQIIDLVEPGTKYDHCQIVAPNDQILKLSNSLVTPRYITQLAQRAVSSLEIPDKFFALPKNEGGVKDTNLAKTRDILYNNFKYRTNYSCGFSVAEQRYMLGLTQKTPFAKNYCDYNNPFAQLSMYIKLCRWDALHKLSKFVPIIGSICACASDALETFKTGDQPASLLLNVPTSKEIQISLTSKYGLDVQASRFLEEGAK